MRALPIGIPKVMVSTVASGDVKPYVGPSDICMMYSVTDVSGINSVSERVLSNAAHALAGMIAHAGRTATSSQTKPAIGLTMFGVTTPCVQGVTKQLEDRYDCLVFHATGTGGQSMEKLVDSGLLAGVIDVTTTEIADEVGGGVLSAGPGRLDAIIRSRMPYVGSCGALDMINFWAMDTVPARYRDRKLHVHNPNVTLMRTTADECRRIGEFLVDKLNRMQGPVRFLIPQGGVSLIDAPGKPFWDPAADKALFDVLTAGFRAGTDRKLIRPAAQHQRPGLHRRPGRELQRHRRHAALRARRRHGSAMARIARKDILDRLRGMIARGEPIIGGGAGTGLSAKCEEAGGIDLIVIYNSGRYRMAGRGSLAGLLAYGNANEVVLEMAREVLPVVKHTPVLAGVNGTDPFLILDDFLRRLARARLLRRAELPHGRASSTACSGQNLEETGMGYGLEVDMIRAAHELDLLTTPYVFSESEAIAMAEAGADIIVCHMGLTTGGSIGAETGAEARRLRRRASTPGRRRPAQVDKDVIVLCHGGPIATPEDATLHPGAVPRMPRLLRSLEHGAPADRAGARRDHTSIQEDPEIGGRTP